MKIREALLDAWNVIVRGTSVELPSQPPVEAQGSGPPIVIQDVVSDPASSEVLLNIPIPVNRVPKIMDDHIDVISKFIFIRVRKAILTGQNKAQLFNINGSQLVAEVKDADFEANLRDLYKQFIKAEHYEYAQECDRIIRKLLVHRLLDEVRHRG